MLVVLRFTWYFHGALCVNFYVLVFLCEMKNGDFDPVFSSWSCFHIVLVHFCVFLFENYATMKHAYMCVLSPTRLVVTAAVL